jgi:hypothetical protein
MPAAESRETVQGGRQRRGRVDAGPGGRRTAGGGSRLVCGTGAAGQQRQENQQVKDERWFVDEWSFVVEPYKKWEFHPGRVLLIQPHVYL